MIEIGKTDSEVSETEKNENIAVESETEKDEMSDTESEKVNPARPKRKKCKIIVSDSSESEKENESIQTQKGSDGSDSEVQKKQIRRKRHWIVSDTSSDGGVEKTDERSNSTKPLHIPRASIGFACPECNFTGKSSGIVHSHMVDVHKLQKLVCGYCKFSTKNSTSFYNDTMRYCRKITQEGKDEQVKDIKCKQSKQPIHVQTLKGSGQKYKCTKCKFITGSTGAVYKHMSDLHDMFKFICSYCQFSTGNKMSMYNHKMRYCRELKDKK